MSGSPPDTIKRDWEDHKPTAQQEIVSLAEIGELTPEAAEAKAVEIGEPILRLPSRELDPMTEARWTLPMLAAWVLWRSPEKVQQYWHKHRRERLDWVSRTQLLFPYGDPGQPVVRRGYRLEQPDPVDFEHVMGAALGLGIEPFDELRAEIWHHLEHGSLPATGTEPSVPIPYERVSRRNRSASIPPVEWENLCANGGSKHHDALFDRGTKEPAYLKVRVERAVVEELWPNRGTSVVNPTDNQKATTKEPRKIGRPIGTGFALTDAKLMPDLHALIEQRMPKGQAYLKIAERAEGNSLAAKAKRLQGRYREWKKKAE